MSLMSQVEKTININGACSADNNLGMEWEKGQKETPDCLTQNLRSRIANCSY